MTSAPPRIAARDGRSLRTDPGIERVAKPEAARRAAELHLPELLQHLLRLFPLVAVEIRLRFGELLLQRLPLVAQEVPPNLSGRLLQALHADHGHAFIERIRKPEPFAASQLLLHAGAGRTDVGDRFGILLRRNTIADRFQRHLRSGKSRLAGQDSYRGRALRQLLQSLRSRLGIILHLDKNHSVPALLALLAVGLKRRRVLQHRHRGDPFRADRVECRDALPVDQDQRLFGRILNLLPAQVDGDRGHGIALCPQLELFYQIFRIFGCRNDNITRFGKGAKRHGSQRQQQQGPRRGPSGRFLT